VRAAAALTFDSLHSAVGEPREEAGLGVFGLNSGDVGYKDGTDGFTIFQLH